MSDRFFRHLNVKRLTQVALFASMALALWMVAAWVDEAWKVAALFAAFIFSNWFTYIEGLDDGARTPKVRIWNHDFTESHDLPDNWRVEIETKENQA